MSEDQPKGWLHIAVTTGAAWLGKQEYVNVLLLLILCSLLYGMYWTIDKGVPMHLQQIQAGYDRMEERQAAIIDRIERNHESQLKYVVDSFREIQRQQDIRYGRVNYGYPPSPMSTPQSGMP